jgi:hypothetical protein
MPPLRPGFGQNAGRDGHPAVTFSRGYMRGNDSCIHNISPDKTFSK